MGIEKYTAPYTPPPIDPEEPNPIPNNPKTSGIHTSFSVLYNHNTGCFELGNAVFSDDEEGMRRLSQYIKRFTPLPHSKVILSSDIPKERPKHLTSVFNPRVPRKQTYVPPSELGSFLDALIDDMPSEKKETE